MQLYKIIQFIILVLVFFRIFSSSDASAQYRISGLIDFSYRNYEIKTGDQKTTDSQFVQTYQANYSNFVWDPRFLVFSANVGYNKYNNTHSADFDAVNYNVSTSFFPAMKYSLDLFANKSSLKTDNALNTTGQEVVTNSFGGKLYLRLNQYRRGGGNNNNNYNNNNYNNFNNRSGIRIPLPEIIISRDHSEVESFGAVTEERDNTSAAIRYRLNSRASVMIDGAMEEFNNLKSSSAYDTKTASLDADIDLSRDADLKWKSFMNDRSTTNITGFDAKTTNTSHSAAVNFKEKEGISHSYSLAYVRQQSGDGETSSKSAQAQAAYQISDDLSLGGGINYAATEYFKKATTSISEIKSEVDTANIRTGISYKRLYTPEFLGAFGFNTYYDFGTGFSKVSGETDGSGWYYSNSAGFGLQSIRWKQDSASLSYSYSSKRDQSPLNNDTEQQSCILSFATYRVPRTSINAGGSYTVQDSRSDLSGVFLTQSGGGTDQRRSVLYDINLIHSILPSLKVGAGASRGDTTATSAFTLSTLSTTLNTLNELVYASIDYSEMLTRNVRFGAGLRQEYRSAGTQTGDNTQFRSNVDYRIRSVFINLEYRWRQDVPENGLKTIEQYYFAKLTRPF